MEGLEKYTTLDALKVAKPELVKKTRELLLDSLADLSHIGVASSGGLVEGHYRYERDKKLWVQDFLYEDHPRESMIRFEFRFEWGHEPNSPRGDKVGQTLQMNLMGIPNANQVLTMFGHYGLDSSSVLVLVWIKRTA